MQEIGTYGFRGEALASISHIAHLSVTTKTKDSNCAWRAHYDSGKLAPPKPGQSAEPKPTAGRQGTQITVEDLFYNVPTRRRAFRSASEEYSKILKMMEYYAVHCDTVAFSCKKHGDSSTSLAIQSSSSTIDRIRQIYGGDVAKELIEFTSSDARWGYNARGWTTNANYARRTKQFILFINHRLVTNENMRRGLADLYKTFLPNGRHPLTYLSLEIDPQRVDVNVHPTKNEVNFLNEEEIIKQICSDISLKLAKVDASRTFKTQTLLPGAGIPLISAMSAPGDSDDASSKNSNTSKPKHRPYENNLVRTDAKLRTITSMLPPSSSLSLPDERRSETQNTTRTSDSAEPEYTADGARIYQHCGLKMVHELRAEVRAEMHNELTEIFGTHTFIGIVDERRRLAAIQGGVRLFLVDYGLVSAEYFYQVGLTNFQNFGSFRFEPPLLLTDLLRVAAEQEKATPGGAENDFEVEDVVELVSRQLLEKRVRKMFHAYYSLDISEDGYISTFPLLLKSYTPCLAKLPRFFLRLGPNVDWHNEKESFRTFLRELASYYVPEQLPASPGPGEGIEEEGVDEEIKERRTEVRRVVENVLFPAFRARMIATKPLMKAGVLEVANLKGLYRVFERC